MAEQVIVKEGRTPRIMPFPMEDIRRDEHGVLRYTNLPPSLLACCDEASSAARITRRWSSWAASA